MLTDGDPPHTDFPGENGDPAAATVGRSADETRPLSRPIEEDATERHAPNMVQPVEGTTERSKFTAPAAQSSASSRTTERQLELVDSSREEGRDIGGSHWLVRLVERSVGLITSAEQRLFLGMLVKNIAAGKSKLQLELGLADRNINRVTVVDIDQQSLLAARIPANAMKITDVSKKNKLHQSKELEMFCSLIDDINRTHPPSGVVINGKKMKLSSKNRYEEGIDYQVNNELGRGLFAVVKTVTDNKSKAQLAEKSVKVHDFKNNEIRAMFDLQNMGDTPIFPELHGFQIDKTDVKLYMEKLERFLTINEVAQQLQWREAITSDLRFQFALSVFHKMAQAVHAMHSAQWYHMDLHGENVMIGLIDDLVEVKFIDFGEAKPLSVLDTITVTTAALYEGLRDEIREDEAIRFDIIQFKQEESVTGAQGGHDPTYSDLRDILGLFCSLVCGEKYHRHEFKKKYKEKKQSIIPNESLPEEKKKVLLSILDEGYDVKVDREPAFIEMVQKQIDSCHSVSSGIQTVLSHLNFRAQPESSEGVVDLEAAAGTSAPPPEGDQELQKDPAAQANMHNVLQGIRNFHTDA